MELQKGIDQYATARALRLSANTLADYGLTYRRLVMHVGANTGIPEISHRQIESLLVKIPGSRKNQLNAYIALASLWTWFVKEGFAREHIIRKVEKPKPAKKEVQPFTEEEVKLLLQVESRAVTLRDRAIMMLLLDTGVRISELCGLTTKDIAGGMIQVLGKGNKYRKIPVTQDTWKVIGEYLAEPRPSRDRHIFLSQYGTPLERTCVLHHFWYIGKKAGVADVHPHRFRHTFAINYLLHGGNIYSLQMILGHTTLDMVKTYLKIAERDLQVIHVKASPVHSMGLGSFVNDLTMGSLSSHP